MCSHSSITIKVFWDMIPRSQTGTKVAEESTAPIFKVK